MVEELDIEAVSSINELQRRLQQLLHDFALIMDEYDVKNHRKYYNAIWKLRANIELCVAILDYGEKSEYVKHTSGELWQQVFLSSLSTPRSPEKIFNLIALSKSLVEETLTELAHAKWQQAYNSLWKARETLGRALGASQPKNIGQQNV